MSKKLDVICANFLKQIESNKKQTLDDIKKTAEFKKLSGAEQQKLKSLLLEKMDSSKEWLKKINKRAKKSELAIDVAEGELTKNSAKLKKKLRKARKLKRKKGKQKK